MEVNNGVKFENIEKKLQGASGSVMVNKQD